MKTIRWLLSCIICLVFLLLNPSSSLLAAEESYPMVCRGGGNMSLSVWYPGSYQNNRDTALIVIKFDKSSHAASQRPPDIGQCAWLDRPIRRDEPGNLRFRVRLPFNGVTFYYAGQTDRLKGHADFAAGRERISEHFIYIYQSIANKNVFYIRAHNSRTRPPFFNVTKFGP